MKLRNLTGVVWCALLVAGCNVVYSARPVGETPVVIVPEEWEGTWIHHEGAVTVVVVDKDKGLLEVGWVEAKQNRLVFESYRAQLLQSGEWLFGNVPDTNGKKRYFWGRLKKQARQLILWVPDVARVKALVAQGKLPGRIEKNGEDVVLDGLDAKQLAAIAAGEHGAILDLEAPVVFFRYGE
jgi:hypothetical protein